MQSAADYDGQPRCGAEGLQWLMGKRASVLETLDLPRNSRILYPGDVITFDFSPERLTIDIDKAGLISSLTCR